MIHDMYLNNNSNTIIFVLEITVIEYRIVRIFKIQKQLRFSVGIPYTLQYPLSKRIVTN